MRAWLKVIRLAAALVIPGGAGRGGDPGPDAAEPGARVVRVVALGDSITKGVRAGVRPEETFAALAESALKADGVDVEFVNRGVGGERTDQALKRLDAVSGHRPRVVTVMYGANDSYVDQGATASRISLPEYTANLRAIVAGLLLRGIEPVLMTEPGWADDAPVAGLGESPNVRLARYMEACRAVAAGGRVPLVDHFARWTEARSKGQALGDWTTDGCHPNPRGHRLLATAMLPTLRAALTGFCSVPTT
jgi:acyl-CoA thioesterase-1